MGPGGDDVVEYLLMLIVYHRKQVEKVWRLEILN